jgi:hypothetical protein
MTASRLKIPRNSRSRVVEFCNRLLEKGPESDVSARLSQRGRKPLIEDYTEQAGVVYRAFGTGLSTTQTAVLVNEWRQSKELSSISWSAVEHFRQTSEVIDTTRRSVKKSGKYDPDSAWSKARLAQCLQFLEMYESGLLPPRQRVSEYPPLFLDGIALWDEHHQKILLGSNYVVVI